MALGAWTIGCSLFIAAHGRKVDGMARVASVHGTVEVRPSRQEHASARCNRSELTKRDGSLQRMLAGQRSLSLHVCPGRCGCDALQQRPRGGGCTPCGSGAAGPHARDGMARCQEGARTTGGG
jgi:hypothetical protein